jgi:hypothetical protein
MSEIRSLPDFAHRKLAEAAIWPSQASLSSTMPCSGAVPSVS